MLRLMPTLSLYTISILESVPHTCIVKVMSARCEGLTGSRMIQDLLVVALMATYSFTTYNTKKSLRLACKTMTLTKKESTLQA